MWNSTDKYRRTIWQCNGKYKGEHRCTTPRLEDELAVVTGLTQKWVDENARTAQDPDEFMAKYREYDARYQELQSKIEALEEKMRDLVSRFPSKTKTLFVKGSFCNLA